MGVGSRLKKLLAERNMSIRELSDKTGISLNTLYNVTKRDNNNIRIDSLQKIAKALNVTMDFLVGTVPEPTTEIVPQEEFFKDFDKIGKAEFTIGENGKEEKYLLSKEEAAIIQSMIEKDAFKAAAEALKKKADSTE